nr:MAG TPA_asm: hypothetical protein [Caudoviricetes sp.]
MPRSFAHTSLKCSRLYDNIQIADLYRRPPRMQCGHAQGFTWRITPARSHSFTDQTAARARYFGCGPSALRRCRKRYEVAIFLYYFFSSFLTGVHRAAMSRQEQTPTPSNP